MATVIGDYISEPTRFRDMIANAPIHHPHQHHHHPHEASSYRSTSRARQSSTGSVQRARSAASSAAGNTATTTDTVAGSDHGRRQAQPEQTEALRRAAPASSHIPSPPTSSSPAVASGSVAINDGTGASMESDVRAPAGASGHTGSSTDAPSASSSAPQNLQQQPSPSSDDFRLSNRTPPAVPSLPQTVIHVRDLAHVRTLANRDGLGGGPGLQNDSPLQQMKYDISGMPIGDVIEMVAALLTKITSTNDLQHDAMQRNVAHQQQANQSSESGSPQISPMSHSVLAFHGKNVPAITILSYLSRIHKYCPTTFEVFLSLLVYFDRMTERVNDMVTRSEEARRQEATRSQTRSSQTQPQSDVTMRDDGEETDSDLADDDDDDDEMAGSPSSKPDEGRVITAAGEVPPVNGPSTYFVVDSFNIHRLIIAGVTCSSKFFSDVFYTNSRYAKVGGLPLAELNHLELQFLVLNDFRLAVPVEDLEAYATMLVEFYAREVVTQTTAAGAE